MLFYFTAECHKAGMVFVNNLGYVKSAGHLYNAARQKKFIVDTESSDSDCWTDLEFMIQLHGTKGIFYGDRPTASDQYYRQFCLAGGYSVSNFARQRRPGPAKLSGRGKILEHLAPVSQMISFMLQDRGVSGAYDLGLDDVEKFLEKGRASTSDVQSVDGGGRSEEEVIEGMFDFCASNFPILGWKGSNSLFAALGTAGRNHTPKNLTPVELLSNLRTTLQSEVVELRFSYFELHSTARRLLLNVDAALRYDLKRKYGQSYMILEPGSPYIVAYILGAGTDTGNWPTMYEAAKTTREISDDLLQKAGKIIAELTKSGYENCEAFITLRCGWKLDVEPPEMAQGVMPPVDWTDVVRARQAVRMADKKAGIIHEN